MPIGEGLVIPFIIGEGGGTFPPPGPFNGLPTTTHGNPFKYIARDLLTWEPLDPLPYAQVRFGRILDGHGTFAGVLPIADPRIQKLAWKAASQPSKAALFVDLAGTLVWGGIIWTRRYKNSGQDHLLQIGAQEFGSYFQKRLQAADYSTLWEHGEDPMKVAKRVLEDAIAKEAEAGQPGHIANHIKVVLHPSTGSGQTVAVQYPGTSLQTVDSILSTLSQMGLGAGFDYSFDVAYAAGTKTPEVTCNIWYPLKGRTAEETQVVILAKDTLEWEYPEDGTQQATAVTETGSGTGGLEAETALSHAPGYPLLEKATSRTQITTQDLLTEIALGDIALVEYPVVTPTITMRLPVPDAHGSFPAGELRLGELDTGDRFLLKVNPVAGQGLNASPRFPQGMSFEWRLTEWTAIPEDQGVPKLILSCGPPPLGYVPAPQPPA